MAGSFNRMPLYAFAFMVFTMANVGLPGTSGFVGEFLTLLGAFQNNTWVAFFATIGVILSAAYALWLYRRVMFGKLNKPALRGMLDHRPPRGGDIAAARRRSPCCSASIRRRSWISMPPASAGLMTQLAAGLAIVKPLAALAP